MSFPTLAPCAMDATTVQTKDNNPLSRRDTSGGLRVMPLFSARVGTPADYLVRLSVGNGNLDDFVATAYRDEILCA